MKSKNKTKQLVGVVCLGVDKATGKRQYGVFNSLGIKLTTYKVHDSGHGAHIAYEEIKKEYKISDAAWTNHFAKILKEEFEQSNK